MRSLTASFILLLFSLKTVISSLVYEVRLASPGAEDTHGTRIMTGNICPIFSLKKTTLTHGNPPCVVVSSRLMASHGGMFAVYRQGRFLYGSHKSVSKTTQEKTNVSPISSPRVRTPSGSGRSSPVIFYKDGVPVERRPSKIIPNRPLSPGRGYADHIDSSNLPPTTPSRSPSTLSPQSSFERSISSVESNINSSPRKVTILDGASEQIIRDSSLENVIAQESPTRTTPRLIRSSESRGNLELNVDDSSRLVSSSSMDQSEFKVAKETSSLRTRATSVNTISGTIGRRRKSASRDSNLLFNKVSSAPQLPHAMLEEIGPLTKATSAPLSNTLRTSSKRSSGKRRPSLSLFSKKSSDSDASPSGSKHSSPRDDNSGSSPRFEESPRLEDCSSSPRRASPRSVTIDSVKKISPRSATKESPRSGDEGSSSLRSSRSSSNKVSPRSKTIEIPSEDRSQSRGETPRLEDSEPMRITRRTSRRRASPRTEEHPATNHSDRTALLDKKSQFFGFSVDTCLELQEDDRILTVVPNANKMMTLDVIETYVELSELYDQIDYDALVNIGDFVVLRVALTEYPEKYPIRDSIANDKKRRSKSFSTPVSSNFEAHKHSTLQ